MKVSGLLPLKMHSDRFAYKNIKIFNEVPLFNNILKAMIESKMLDEICIFASEQNFMEHVRIDSNKIKFIKRSESLDQDTTSISEVIKSFCLQSDADIVTLCHATSPLLSSETIQRAVQSVMSGTNDSALAVVPMQKFAWFDGKPFNYDLSRALPRTQDLQKIYVEQSGLYVFRRNYFLQTGRRIGDNPNFVEVDESEGIDIDTKRDFDLAVYLAKVLRGQ
jgi:CMP-N-acetylneuraminic acid synthetase